MREGRSRQTSASNNQSRPRAALALDHQAIAHLRHEQPDRHRRRGTGRRDQDRSIAASCTSTNPHTDIRGHQHGPSDRPELKMHADQLLSATGRFHL